MSRAAGKFTVTGGNEQTVREAPGEVKLTRVAGTQTFDGDIAGTGSVEWVFCYRPDGSARFVGFQRIEGTIGRRSGGVVLESVGDHTGGRSKGRWHVIEGSGTGKLAGMSGDGSFDAPGGREVDYELDYNLE